MFDLEHLKNSKEEKPNKGKRERKGKNKTYNSRNSIEPLY